MRWMYRDQSFAEADPASSFSVVGVQTIGGHRLRVVISLLVCARPAEDTVSLLWLSGALSTEAGSLALLHTDENLALCTASSAAQRQIRLAADLTGRQVDALSNLRAGDGSLRLHVAIWGVATGQAGPERLYEQAWFTVAAPDWLTAWAAMAPSHTFRIEVSSPRIDPDSPLATSIGHLHHASVNLRRFGEGDSAVGECRRALEAAGYGKLPPARAAEADARAEGHPSLDDRLAALKRSLYRLTHLPHHPGPEAFSRPQAQLVLEVTTALLALEAKEIA